MNSRAAALNPVASKMVIDCIVKFSVRLRGSQISGADEHEHFMVWITPRAGEAEGSVEPNGRFQCDGLAEVAAENRSTPLRWEQCEYCTSQPSSLSPITPWCDSWDSTPSRDFVDTKQEPSIIPHVQQLTPWGNAHRACFKQAHISTHKHRLHLWKRWWRVQLLYDISSCFKCLVFPVVRHDDGMQHFERDERMDSARQCQTVPDTRREES